MGTEGKTFVGGIPHTWPVREGKFLRAVFLQSGAGRYRGCPELCVNAFLKFDHSILELDAESGQRCLPVPDRQGPFSADVLHGCESACNTDPLSPVIGIEN